MKRMFTVSLIVEQDCDTLADGLKRVKEKFNNQTIIDIKPVVEARTVQQNKALHLLFSQLADELNEKGLDLRASIWNIELSWNPYLVKEKLWKPIQKIITGKNSTTKLDKTKEIDLIYDNLNRALIEKTKGEIELPPFPSIEFFKPEEG